MNMLENRGKTMNLSIRKAFAIPFCDNGWIGKIIIGGLISSTIFTVPIANGYLVLYLSSLLKSNCQKMPLWTDIKNILIISLRLLVIDIVYLLPVAFIGLITKTHDVRSTAIFWVPVFLLVIFFLNLAHIRFVQNNFKISAGFNISEILDLLRSKAKEYIVIYIFNAFIMLIFFMPLFIDNTPKVSGLFYYSLEVITSMFSFYLYLVIYNMLAMTFRN